MEKIDFPKPKMHLFVCINDRSNRPNNTMPSCAQHVSVDDVREVKRWICEQGLARDVFCTKAKCLGLCNTQGGVAAIYPRGDFVKGIKGPDDLKELIKKELKRE